MRNLINALVLSSVFVAATACGKGDVSAAKAALTESVGGRIGAVEVPQAPTMTADEKKAFDEEVALEKLQSKLRAAALINGFEAVRALKPAYCGFVVRDNTPDYWDAELKVATNWDYDSDTTIPVFVEVGGAQKALVSGAEFGTFYWVYFRKGDISRNAVDTEAHTQWKADAEDAELIFDAQVSDLCKPVLLKQTIEPKKEEKPAPDSSKNDGPPNVG